MFYCDDCRKKNQWPESIFSKSRGPCEVCGKQAICNNVHHSSLPRRRRTINGVPLVDEPGKEDAY
jgi:hypothetical protein